MNDQAAPLEAGDAVVAALAAGGVEVLFFTSGSELAFFQEAIAKAQAHGRAAPRLVLFTHEYVALNAALGYAAATGTPTAAAAHVDVGTQHFGAGIHSAMRSRLPLVIIAGEAPSAAGGSRRGSRDAAHFWAQEIPDQAAIVRQYMKWARRMGLHDNPGLLTSRALQVAMAPPCGPVYLGIPREVALSREAQPPFPSVHDLGVPRRHGLPSDSAREIATRLFEAREPVAIIAGSGRDPESVAVLVALCEAAGMPAVDAASRANGCFPMDHPLYQPSARLAEFDFVLVLDADVPWVPGKNAPSADAFVCAIDEDPVKQDFQTYEFRANLRAHADPRLALQDIRAEFGRLGACAAAPARAKRWSDESARREQARRDEATARSKDLQIDPDYLAFCIGELLGATTILVDDTLGSNPLHRHLRGTGGAGRYFRNPASAGGWGPGFALGVKMGRPDADVILATGDGFYQYGSAAAALLAGVRQRAATLTVVFQNRSYSTTTHATAALYPGGYAQRAGFEGGYMDPPMDFALEAQAAGCHGENVRSPSELLPALHRGLAWTRKGRPAVVAVWLPRLMDG